MPEQTLVITIRKQTFALTSFPDDGARLEIMNKPQMQDSPKALTQTGYIHIAFSVGSKEKVDELTAKLKEDGYEIISGPRTTGDGYYESCVVGIEGKPDRGLLCSKVIFTLHTAKI